MILLSFRRIPPSCCEGGCDRVEKKLGAGWEEEEAEEENVVVGVVEVHLEEEAKEGARTVCLWLSPHAHTHTTTHMLALTCKHISSQQSFGCKVYSTCIYYRCIYLSTKTNPQPLPPICDVPTVFEANRLPMYMRQSRPMKLDAR